MNFPYFWKLWDRGVDIGVGVVTSLAIAAIGLASWRFKLRLDLHADERKQRQQHKIQHEIEAEQRAKLDIERYARLVLQREALAEAAVRESSVTYKQSIWEEYLRWIRAEGLDAIPSNLKILVDNAHVGRILAGRTVENTDELSAKIADTIRSTVLPGDEERK